MYLLHVYLCVCITYFLIFTIMLCVYRMYISLYVINVSVHVRACVCVHVSSSISVYINFASVDVYALCMNVYQYMHNM